MGLSFIQLDLGSPAGYAKFLDLPSVASFYSHTTSFSNYINWVLLFLFLCLFAYVNIHFQILLCVLEFGYKQIHFTPEAHIIVCIKIAASYLLVNVEWVWTSVAVLIKSLQVHMFPVNILSRTLLLLPASHPNISNVFFSHLRIIIFLRLSDFL